jgi:hypothetical protein
MPFLNAHEVSVVASFIDSKKLKLRLNNRD